MCGFPPNEERIYTPMKATQHVHPNGPTLLAALGDCARQKRYAHIGSHASDHTVECAELETGCRRPAELGHHLLEPLPIRASGPEDENRSGYSDDD